MYAQAATRSHYSRGIFLDLRGIFYNLHDIFYNLSGILYDTGEFMKSIRKAFVQIRVSVRYT